MSAENIYESTQNYFVCWFKKAEGDAKPRKHLRSDQIFWSGLIQKLFSEWLSAGVMERLNVLLCDRKNGARICVNIAGMASMGYLSRLNTLTFRKTETPKFYPCLNLTNAGADNLFSSAAPLEIFPKSSVQSIATIRFVQNFRQVIQKIVFTIQNTAGWPTLNVLQLDNRIRIISG